MTPSQRLGMLGANLLLTELFEINDKVNALVSFQDIPGAEGLCIVEVEPIPGSTGNQHFPGRQGWAGWQVEEQSMDRQLVATAYLLRAPQPDGPIFAFLESDENMRPEHWATPDATDRYVEMMDALTENYLSVMNQHVGDIDMLRTNRLNHGELRYEEERNLLLKGPSWSEYGPRWIENT
jgi:hypothetical protein